MRRFFYLLLLIIPVLLAVGFVVLGAFPPEPRQQEIKRVLPNDKLGQRP